MMWGKCVSLRVNEFPLMSSLQRTAAAPTRAPRKLSTAGFAFTTRAPELGDGLALAAAVPLEVEERAVLVPVALLADVVDDWRELVVGAALVVPIVVEIAMPRS
jgi:hypothetical protein